jgi:hypothetical protein
METILLIAVVGFICALCFVLGAKVGQKVVKGEEIETPKISALNPLKMYEEHKEKEEAKKEMDKLEVILGNIERYDGTDRGQEDVPM